MNDQAIEQEIEAKDGTEQRVTPPTMRRPHKDAELLRNTGLAPNWPAQPDGNETAPAATDTSGLPG
jgi:hypothetical protein